MQKLAINDVEFITQGFLQLIQRFADEVGNPLYSLEEEY
jgi:hypothetical protein